MKKPKHEHPPLKLPKDQTRQCPTGRCEHRHIKATGPCTEQGCGCHGSYGKKRA